MANLTEYTGNAGLGVGSAPQVAVPGNLDFKTVNDTVRDIMILSNERNILKFKQKKADRDNLNNLILQNQVPPGEIEPGYYKEYDAAKKKSEEAFNAWKGNWDDHEGFKKYQESITDLQAVAAHARTNTEQLKSLRLQEANETLPSRKKAIQDHIDEMEKQDFWKSVDPYQHLHDFNMDTINGFAKPVTTTIPTDNPAITKTRTSFDYDDIVKNARNALLDVEKQNDIQELRRQFDNYDQPLLKKTIDAMNAQIAKYNAQTGKSVEPVKTVTDKDTGIMKIHESMTDFAAKVALTNQEQMVSEKPVVDYKLLHAQYEAGRNQLEAKKLGIEAAKANAYISNLRAKTAKFLSTNKQEAAEISNKYEDFINALRPRGMTLTTTTGGEVTGKRDEGMIPLDQLPESYRYIVGPVMGTTTKTVAGKSVQVPTGKIEVGKLEPFTSSNGKEYYIPRYVDPTSGEKVSMDDKGLNAKFQDLAKHGFVGSYDDFIRIKLKRGELELVLQGKNGVANYTTMAQSAKLIQAQAGKKGEENIEGATEPPPAEAPFEGQTPESPSDTNNQ